VPGKALPERSGGAFAFLRARAAAGTERSAGRLDGFALPVASLFDA
jgi:hypothetical protein